MVRVGYLRIFLRAVVAMILSAGSFVAPGQAVPIPINATPLQPTVSVRQNSSGSDFIIVTLSAGGPASVGFSSITALRPLFAGMDGMDRVTGSAIGTNFPGKGVFPCRTDRAILANTSCSVDLTFTTLDSRDPDPDLIPGLWDLSVNIVAFQVGNPNNSIGLTPTVRVVVTDPEPPSLTLFALGLAAVAALRLRSSARTRRAVALGEAWPPRIT